MVRLRTRDTQPDPSHHAVLTEAKSATADGIDLTPDEPVRGHGRFLLRPAVTETVSATDAQGPRRIHPAASEQVLSPVEQNCPIQT
jgi:hypothetical protein